MKIICDKTLLSAAIDGVSRAVTPRSTIPALEGILLKAEGFNLTLTGYDMELGIVTTIEANVLEAGDIVLNAKLLNDMVRRMPAGSPDLPRADDTGNFKLFFAPVHGVLRTQLCEGESFRNRCAVCSACSDSCRSEAERRADRR